MADRFEAEEVLLGWAEQQIDVGIRSVALQLVTMIRLDDAGLAVPVGEGVVHQLLWQRALFIEVPVGRNGDVFTGEFVVIT